KEITDPAHQRKPRYMTTAIFRDHPAQAARYHGEGLEEEGWFDDTGWDIPGWFEEHGDKFSDGRPADVGAGKAWARDGWRRALAKWEDYGERNHMELPPNELENYRNRANAFREKMGLTSTSGIPELREDTMSPEDRENYRALRFLWEYDFYRRLTNFPH